MSIPEPPPEVAAVYARYPEEPRARLMDTRALIFEEAQLCEAGVLTETLKWGEPAYLTEQSRVGHDPSPGLERQSPRPAHARSLRHQSGGALAHRLPAAPL